MVQAGGLSNQNVKITFSASVIPGNSQTTFYVRNLRVSSGSPLTPASGTFSIAQSTNGAVVSGLTSVFPIPAGLTVTTSDFNSCPFNPTPQFSYASLDGNGNFILSDCMNQYKLSKFQLSVAMAIPALVICSIILLILLAICLVIGSRVTRLGMFKAIFVVLCLIPIIFLIAAIGVAGAVLPSIAGCYSGKGASITDVPTYPNNGPLPIGASLTFGYNALTGNPGATVTTTTIVPGAASANLIAAVVTLFFVMIYGVIKTDFEGANEMYGTATK